MKSQITTLLMEFLTSKRKAMNLVTNMSEMKKDLNMNDHVADFKLLPTRIVFGFDDPNDQIAMLNKLITDCIADHAPIKKVKFTRPPAPWMKDPELVTAKKHLEHLRSLKNVNGTGSSELSDYRKSKVRYKKLIETTKVTFLRKARNSKNPKEVRDAVNPIINPPKNRIRQNTSELNNYFTTHALNLSGKENEPQNESEILQLLNRVPDSNAFTINCTTYHKVQKIILNLRNDCSSGHDNIRVKFVKPVVDEITSPIVHIINTSIDKEIFPDSRKVARVCPIPKIDNPVTVKDFRPISILPVLSKVYEKVILSQLLSYIERSAVYNPTQSGFRKGHSTTTLLPKFRSGIRKALNGNEITISILNYYSKAFGTINHKTFWKSSFH